MTAATDDAVEPAEQAAYRAEVRAWYEANATPRRADDPWATNVHLDEESARRHFEDSKAWLGTLHAAGYSGIASRSTPARTADGA